MGGNDYVTIDLESDDEYDKDSYHGDDDFPSMLVKLFTKINIKTGIFIFLLGMLIFSDIFVRTILVAFKGAVNHIEGPTTHGTIIQLTFLVLGYLIIDLLVQSKYL